MFEDDPNYEMIVSAYDMIEVVLPPHPAVGDEGHVEDHTLISEDLDVVKWWLSKLYVEYALMTANKAEVFHKHAAADIETGTLAPARLPAATESAAGAVERATTAEAEAGTDTTRYITPAALAAVLAPLVSRIEQLEQLETGV